MSIVVEDGTGLATADSYISVADASAYLANYGEETAFDALTTPDQENALKIGTRWMDTSYGGKWDGSRKYEVQALDWPRVNVEDFDGYAVASTSVPLHITYATALIAVASLTAELGPDIAPGLSGSVDFEKNKVGPLEFTQSYSGGRNMYYIYTKVEALIREFLLTTGIGVIRG